MAETVTVSIQGKDYQIACEPGEVEALRESARYVDDKMNEIKSGSAVLGLDRLAVLAALNIANDFLAQRTATEDVVADNETTLRSLDGKLNEALNRLKIVATQDYRSR